METTATIEDIQDIHRGRTLLVDCTLECNEKQEKQDMMVELDIAKMGIDPKGEFELELTKDFSRETEKFNFQNHRLPTAMELKGLVENHFYGMGKYESKFSDTLLNMVYGEYGIEGMQNRLQFLLDINIYKREDIKGRFTPHNLREFDRLAKVYKLQDAPRQIRSFVNSL